MFLAMLGFCTRKIGRGVIHATAFIPINTVEYLPFRRVSTVDSKDITCTVELLDKMAEPAGQ